MDDLLARQEEPRAKRHYGIVMAFAVVVMLGVVGYWYIVLIAPVSNLSLPHDEKSLLGHATPTTQFARVAPVELYIPKLNLRTGFVPPLGLESDQTVAVPDSYTDVGWYKYGATPGEIGPAVILGHVDSYEGPAVFYPLGQLKPGDEIHVKRADNTVAVFTVERLERVSQDAFPTQAVYGQIDYAGLRLVTCSGTFNRSEQKYSHNLVVFAQLDTEKSAMVTIPETPLP